ncbi:MAG: amidohydrolase family protein [Clostridia bacterium]|nr:amidohydrolase family protein [Clostridia bacterium]
MKKAYINGFILDGTENMTPVKGIIITENGRIAYVLPEDADISGCEKIDLGGKYIMPGLINLHIHLPAGGKPSNKQSDTRKLVKLVTSNAFTRKIAYLLCAGSVKTQLMSGVTTVRTVGGILNIDSRIRDDVNSGKTVGPRILAADMAVSVPGGHMAGSLAYEATSAEEAAEYVEKIAESKPDLIKLMITGGVLDATEMGEPGVLKMPPEYVKAACDKAHSLGLMVASHVESPEGVRVALENGVDTIEHGAMPDEDIIRLFKEKGASHIATLSPAMPYALFDREVSHITEMEKFNGDVVFKGIIECAKACLANGIPVGLGTDTGCPYITHYNMWREVYYFHKLCGVSTAFALHTATLKNAQIVGIDKETGSIEKGKSADFVITEKNPLDDLEALRNISAVVFRGKYISEPKVKKMAAVEAELDKLKF